MGTLISIITIVSAVAGLWWRISALMEANRIASEEGRRRLYDQIEGRIKGLSDQVNEKLNKLEETFVRRDVYDAERKAMLHVFEEQSRQMYTLSNQINDAPERK